VKVKSMLPSVIQFTGLMPFATIVGVAGATRVRVTPFTEVHPPTLISRSAYEPTGACMLALLPETATLAKLPPSYVIV